MPSGLEKGGFSGENINGLGVRCNGSEGEDM